MKSLIVYYSMSNNTQYVAEEINKELKGDILRLIPVKDYPNKGIKKFYFGGKSAIMGDTPKLESYNINIKDYDLIIFGTPIWASTFTPPIRTFINDNKELLKDKKIAIFTCSSGGSSSKAIDKLKSYLNIDKFINELSLIDPKNKENNNNLTKIKEFCKKINKEV